MLRRILASASIAFVSILTSAAAMATAPRTFVASYGNDANPCSLTLPCRAFAAAIAQTNDSGEVIVLDSAGYGPVTITQSVSITAPAGIYAGISMPTGVTGVTITGVGISVVLRGLTISGPGGAYGIHMIDGLQLAVEKCVISNMNDFSTGVLIEAPALVTITDTTIRAVGYGIEIGFGATANIANSQVISSHFLGAWLHGGPSGTTTNISISDTLLTGTGVSVSDFSYCIDNNPDTGTIGNVSVTRATVTGCLGAIGNAPLDAGTMSVSGSMVTGNINGFSNISPGTFLSLGNNHVSENITDTTGTITVIGGK